MAHPSVQIDKPNKRDALVAHLNNNLTLFTTLPGVVGVTLNGGLSRGYGDHLSEIDVTLYLESDTYTHWQHGHAPVGMGIQRINGALYDIKSTNIAQEHVETWSSDTRWDSFYAKVLYDPCGIIESLLKQNELYRPDPLEASGAMFRAWWLFKLAGDIWIFRDDPLQAHFILNQSITELVKAVYMANREFIPHEKWLIHMSRTLDWTPENWISRLTQIMCELSPDIQNVETRQQNIAALWQEVDSYIVSITDKGYHLNLMHRKFYDLLGMLLEDAALPIEKWQTVADLSLLNSAPFNLCVSVTANSIVLDRVKWAALTPEDLYSWHYALVKAIRDFTPEK